MLVATISALCFGLSNLLIGKVSAYGLYVRPYILLGNFTIGILYLLYMYFFRSKSFNQLLIDFNIVEVEYYKIDYSFVLKVCTDALLLMAGEYLLLLTFESSLYAEINQGVISSLFILSAINTAIFTWFMVGVRNRLFAHTNDHYYNFMYREQFNLYHGVALILILASAIMLMFNPYSDDKGYVEVFNKYLPIFPPINAIFLMALTTIYFTAKDLVFKSHVITYLCSPYKLYTLTVSFGGVFMLLLTLLQHFQYGIDKQEFLEGFMGGVLQSTATF